MKKILVLIISIITFTNLGYASFPILTEQEPSSVKFGQIFGQILIVGVGSFVLYLIYKLFRFLLRIFLEKRGFLVSSLSFIGMAIIGIPILTLSLIHI